MPPNDSPNDDQNSQLEMSSQDVSPIQKVADHNNTALSMSNGTFSMMEALLGGKP